jgi:hypothetical protein
MIKTGTHNTRRNTMEINHASSEYLFLTEILNDLHKHGFQEDGKAATMLKDWRNEFRRSGLSFPKTKQKQVHMEVCGPGLW